MIINRKSKTDKMRNLLLNFFRQLFNIRARSSGEISPEDILLDSHNIPNFDTYQFEGRLAKPISRITLLVTGILFTLVIVAFIGRAWNLQIARGESLLHRSENNRLRHTPLFASRGLIFDRNKVELAWNSPNPEDPDILSRHYTTKNGLAHILGYVHYPSKDSSGFYYREDFEGADGIEKTYDEELSGENGLNLIEVDARGKTQSNSIIKPAKQGDDITLSIDAKVTSRLYEAIKDIAMRVGFQGGAGIIMNVENGEILAMTSYPEFSSEIMSKKDDAVAVNSYLNSPAKPFLNRATDGLYTPGSIVKPFMALAALNEGTIDPNTKILSTGSISVPNDYDPKLFTIFKDWKAHGWVDMKHAIAVSSDVYFYEVGGGFKNVPGQEDIKGLGITKIDEYMARFGFAESIVTDAIKTPSAVTPTPQWKKQHFNGETWRLGNTYHTSIGQYGFQVTPLHMARAVAAIATNGRIINPSLVKDQPGKIIRTVDIAAEDYELVQSAMRLAVTSGTAASLNVPYVEIAAKTGTAELGLSKENINSWMVGYMPYKNPKYAFAVVMEKGSSHYLIGAGAAMRELIDWMSLNTPEYLGLDPVKAVELEKVKPTTSSFEPIR